MVYGGLHQQTVSLSHLKQTHFKRAKTPATPFPRGGTVWSPDLQKRYIICGPKDVPQAKRQGHPAATCWCCWVMPAAGGPCRRVSIFGFRGGPSEAAPPEPPQQGLRQAAQEEAAGQARAGNAQGARPRGQSAEVPGGAPEAAPAAGAAKGRGGKKRHGDHSSAPHHKRQALATAAAAPAGPQPPPPAPMEALPKASPQAASKEPPSGVPPPPAPQDVPQAAVQGASQAASHGAPPEAPLQEVQGEPQAAHAPAQPRTPQRIWNMFQAIFGSPSRQTET